MKCQAVFSLRKKKNRISSFAFVTGTLRVNSYLSNVQCLQNGFMNRNIPAVWIIAV